MSFKMGLGPGARGRGILVTAGNGGVGGFALQLARHFGMHPIISTNSPASDERVKALGELIRLRHSTVTLHTSCHHNNKAVPRHSMVCKPRPTIE